MEANYIYIIYKITNTANGKIYIGAHKTTNINDGYMGSGKLLLRAQAKHGIENFIKEILYVFDTPNEMYAKESELVNEEFVSRTDTYNLKVGGLGGFDYINKNQLNLYGLNGKTPNIKDNFTRGIQTFRANLLDPEYRKAHCEMKSKNMKSYYQENGSHWTGRKHRTETKEKIGKRSKVHQAGTGNSQFGTMWIYSTEEKRCMKIRKDDPIPNGWYKGRKFKF